MPESVNSEKRQILFDAQKQILSGRLNTDAVLHILSESFARLFGKSGFAMILFDPSSQLSSVRFNDGLELSSLAPLCDRFTAERLEGKAPTTGLTANGTTEPLLTMLIGDLSNPLGLLIVRNISSEEGIFREFKDLALTSVNMFCDIDMVKLRMEEMGALLEVGRVVSSTLNLKELLTKIMAMATQVMRCETSTVYLVDEQTNELYFHIVAGDPNVGAKLQEIRLPMGTGLAGWCAQARKPVIVPDTEKDPRFFKGADKKSGFVTRSMICVPMILKEKCIGVLQVLNRTGEIPFNNHDLATLEHVATQAVSAIENAKLYENIQKVYLSTIEVLATAIDAKDPYTQGHSRRVTLYSVAIAEEMKLPPKFVETIRYAGLLHDIGKIGIQDAIIRKPGRLTNEEYEIIKTHPSIGAKILRPVDFLADKIPGVLHHHEYFDGRGYPDHLTGENIPLQGRIICVADAFDAMTTNRPYRRGLSVNTAVGELKKFSGKQFDPICVEAFLRAFDNKLHKYFKKDDKTDDMYLIDDEPKHPAAVEVKPAAGGAGTPSTQPFPPVNAFGSNTPQSSSQSGQPFPPINAFSNPPKGSAQNDQQPKQPQQPQQPLSHAPAAPSTQPFPPVNTIDD